MNTVEFHNRLMQCATLLASADGENTEYDRALVELVATSMSLPRDHWYVIAGVVLSEKSPLWKERP